MATTIGMGAKKNSAKEDNKELKKAKSQIAEFPPVSIISPVSRTKPI